jgi:hypothetical protein
MANTYIQIGSTVTVGSGGASSIDFSSIPSTYTDLKVVMSLRDNNGTTNGLLLAKFNGNSANYSRKWLYGTGSAAASTNGTSESVLYIGYSNGAGSTSNTFASSEMYIPNYAGSTDKSVSVDGAAETNATTVNMVMVAGLWSNSSAINQITLTPNGSDTFVQYSTATLYGISKS